MTRRVRFRTTDYAAREPGHRQLLNRGFWLTLPRFIPLCRLLGHRPVVDGTDSRYSTARWVACDRCGTRPDWQGALSPAGWSIGAPYDGAFDGAFDGQYIGTPDMLMRRPGPWPAHPEGTIGGQLVVGGQRELGASLAVGVGGDGSEDVFTGQVALHPLFALYLSTEGHGTGLQRRLRARNDYTDRVIGLSVHDGKLWWEMWAEEGHWSSSDPWWRSGDLSIDPRDWVLGRRRYWHENIGEPQPATIRLAHGDDHDVMLQLQRQTFGRENGAGRRSHSWCVDIHVLGHAISYRSDNDWKDGLVAWAVDIPDHAVTNERWIEVACDLAAARVTADRARYVYHHSTGVPAA